METGLDSGPDPSIFVANALILIGTLPQLELDKSSKCVQIPSRQEDNGSIVSVPQTLSEAASV